MGIPTATELEAHTSLGTEFLSRVLVSLIQAESTNPGKGETQACNVIDEWLRPLGIERRWVEFADGRPSLGARLSGEKNGPTLILNGHLDTVPIDDRSLWTVDPFEGNTNGGYIYGRGSCDMKAGLAAAIGVAYALKDYASDIAGSLVLHFAAGEERGEPGTLSLLDAGFTGDYGLVLEPTQLNVATATRGAAFIRIRIKGRSIHASRAHLTINPISRLQAVLTEVNEHQQEAASRPHPLFSGGSCTPTTIAAGVKANAVPDYVDLTLDRRLLPTESPCEDLEALRARLMALQASDPDFQFDIEHIGPSMEGAEIAADSAFASHIREAAEHVTGEPIQLYGSPFGSDMRNLVNDAGIEAVNFGPGSVEECHCPDERVAIQQLRHAALTTANVTIDLLSRTV